MTAHRRAPGADAAGHKAGRRGERRTAGFRERTPPGAKRDGAGNAKPNSAGNAKREGENPFPTYFFAAGARTHCSIAQRSRGVRRTEYDPPGAPQLRQMPSSRTGLPGCRRKFMKSRPFLYSSCM